MESFVDNIIKTDKKARAIIDQAQKNAKNQLAMAKVEALREVERRKENQQEQIQNSEQQMHQDEKTALIKADEDYLNAKKKMDKIFADNVDLWETDIIKAVISTK